MIMGEVVIMDLVSVLFKIINQKQNTKDMSKFLELHRIGKDETSILINVDYIAYIQNGRNETIIYLGLKSNTDNSTDLLKVFIKEPYEEVKTMIIGS